MIKTILIRDKMWLKFNIKVCSLSFQQAKVEELVQEEEEEKIKMKFSAIFAVAVVLLASESLALFK